MKNDIIGVFLTDTHLFEKRTKADAITDDNFQVVKKAFQQAIEEADKNNLSRVYFLGDFFDSRKQQSARLIEMAEEIFDLFIEPGITLVIIPGNHDKVDYTSKHSFLSPYRHHPQIEYFESAAFIDEDHARIHLIPFLTNDLFVQELEKAKDNLHPTKKNVLGTHIGIHGALRNSGEEEVSPITFDMFADFDKVLIGHYHNFSTFNQKRIVYIGSAIQHNFGEDDNKGLTLLHTNLRTSRVYTSFRRYETLVVNVAELSKENQQELIASNNVDNTHLRLVITGDATLIKALDRSELETFGIKCTFKPTDADEEMLVDLVAANVTTHTEETLKESFKQFCIQNQYDEADGLIYLEPVLNHVSTN